MTQYARILEDEYGELPEAVVEVISIGDAWDRDHEKPTLVYKGLDENSRCNFVSSFGRYELLEGDHETRPGAEASEDATMFEDVTLRLPVGLKQRVQEHADGKDRTLSQNVAEALEFWVGRSTVAGRPAGTYPRSSEPATTRSDLQLAGRQADRLRHLAHAGAEGAGSHSPEPERSMKLKSLTEMKRWATLRCAHCGHRFRWSRDARSSFGGNDGKVYHGPCIAYIQWRRTAEERLTVVDLLAEVSGLNTNDMQAVAHGRAPVGEEHIASNLVWRVFYDLSKLHDHHSSEP